MASYMRRVQVCPVLVLCSSAVRAVQTYDAIRPVLGSSVELSVEDDLFAASATGLLGRLRDLPERASAVLLIGHNPSVHDLAVELAGDGERTALARLRLRFPTGALATLSMAGAWGAVAPGQAYLESFTVPSDLGRSVPTGKGRGASELLP
jgi:phosphohistidine phosphatase